MKKILLVIHLLIFVTIIFVSCSKGNPGNNSLDCSTVTNKAWAANVEPIIQTFCNQASCHDVASVNGPGPLTNYSQVFSARTAIREAVRTGLMPQNTTLTTAQKNSIICWIDGGAPNN